MIMKRRLAFVFGCSLQHETRVDSDLGSANVKVVVFPPTTLLSLQHSIGLNRTKAHGWISSRFIFYWYKIKAVTRSIHMLTLDSDPDSNLAWSSAYYHTPHCIPSYALHEPRYPLSCRNYYTSALRISRRCSQRRSSTSRFTVIFRKPASSRQRLAYTASSTSGSDPRALLSALRRWTLWAGHGSTIYTGQSPVACFETSWLETFYTTSELSHCVVLA